ncbi:MAG: hypothetical protein ACI4JB_09655 [Porcipelethomonas sp.]
MTRKAAAAVLLAGMAVSAVIIIITISGSIKRQRIRAENLAEQSVTETQPTEVGYYLKEYEGELVVFRGDSKTPFRRLGVSTDLMSEQDKLMLAEGIFAPGEKELKALIEDYTS